MYTRRQRPPSTSASSTSTAGSLWARRLSISVCSGVIEIGPYAKKAGDRPLSVQLPALLADLRSAVRKSQSSIASGRRPMTLTGSRRARSRPAAQTLDGIEDRLRDLRLGGAWHVLDGLLALGVHGEDRDLIHVRVETNVLARDVVHDDRVESLLGQLPAGVVDRALAVLGGEADQRLTVPPLRRQRSEHVRGGLQLQLQARAARLLDLPLRRVTWSEVGYRGRHQQHVALRELSLAGLQQLGRGAQLMTDHARRARQ